MKWQKTDYPGVRCREHPTRKHNKAPDKYFAIRYRYQGEQHEEAVGWASQRWTAKKVAQVLTQLQQNQATGTSPVTLAEWRKIEDEKRRLAAEAEAKRDELPQTFNALADEFMTWAKGHKKSWKWDEQRLNDYLRPVLGRITVSEIESHHIEAIKAGLMEQGRSPATIQQILGLVRRAINHGRHLYKARFYEVCPHDPMQGVRIPRPHNRRIRYLSLQEVGRLLKAAKGKDILLHDICLLSLYTGLRRSEIAELTVGRVDLDNSLIHVLDAKSGQDETVEIPEHIKEMLDVYITDRAANEYVFPARGGGQIKSISQRFKKIIDGMGLNAKASERESIVFHTCRHTYISWLVIEGTDLRTVQAMARHRSLEMTMRYAHLAPSSRRSAANRLPRPGKILPFSESKETGSSSD